MYRLYVAVKRKVDQALTGGFVMLNFIQSVRITVYLTHVFVCFSLPSQLQETSKSEGTTQMLQPSSGEDGW